MKSKFGDIENPLLVSVRSGARASMPGMMDTILNLGLNDEVAASLYSPESGIYMELFTNQPGLQFYSGNLLSGSVVGKKGIAYPQRAAVCLAPQKYPNSPNKKNWPSPYLKPGEKYFCHVAYRFSIR